MNKIGNNQQVTHLLPLTLDLVALSLQSSKMSFNDFDGTILSKRAAKCENSNFLSS